jgi:hypothetical protein
MPMATGHPSYGLIVSPDGTIYFCDVLHHDGALWKVLPNGDRQTVLTNEHCHFIYQDVHGTIYGSDDNYVPRDKTNYYSFWKLGQNFEKEMIIEPTIDPEVFSGTNFVVDSEGNIYFSWDNKIRKRLPNGETAPYVDKEFGRIMSLQMDVLNNLYVVDKNSNEGSIFRIRPDKSIEIVADHLLDIPPKNPPFKEPRFNMLYAAHVDSDLKVYVANSGSRRITRISLDGSKDHIYHAQPPYYPVAYYKNGKSAYVMEAGFISGIGNIGPRIIKIEGDRLSVVADLDEGAYGSVETPSSENNRLIRRAFMRQPWFIALGLFLVGSGVIFIILRTSLKKNK